MEKSTAPVPGNSAPTSARIVRNYALLLALVWTLTVTGSILWNWYHEQQEARDSARVNGEAQFTKDLIYRRWNAGHGGVYVPVTDATRPNPYLAHLPNRDIETLDGRHLTLINPAYMTRKVHELGWETDGIRGHITSLNPIRPENAPDGWERKALERFEEGDIMVSEAVEIDGAGYMRFMGALVTEENCLKCHAQQGYTAGDIRGGISVSVPLASYKEIACRHMHSIGMSHLVLWLVGLAGLGLSFFGILRQIYRWEQAETALRETVARARHLETIQQTAGTLAHEINNPLTGVIANLQLVMELQGRDAPCSDCLQEAESCANRIRDAVGKLSALNDAPKRPYIGGREIIDIRKEQPPS